MTASIFDDQLVEPNEQMLSAELGEANGYFNEICLFIRERYESFIAEWKYYGKSSGWVLKLLVKKRNVLFIIPCRGYFRVSFTFGDKAVHEIMEKELPGFNKQELLNAKKYAEGRTIQFEVKTEDECRNVLVLIAIKLDN